MMYNWQQKDWPSFKYKLQNIEDMLYDFAEETGQIAGLLTGMEESDASAATIHMMVAEAIKTSEIEGEFLNRQDVASSIKNKLGLNKQQEPVKDKRALGAGQLMVIVRDTYAAPLTKEMLFEWHRLLLSQSKGITLGKWRHQDEPMQVVSGVVGKEKIHFEAPPSEIVTTEMKSFIQWFNDSAPGGKNEIKKAPVRSAIAHLYFESIHPFEDGNGRIGRAIAEKALSQTIGRPVLLSLSQTIEADKKSYYQALEQAQQSNEITSWLEYFVNVILTAQKTARDFVDFTLRKAKFFDKHKDQLNERQLKAINKMFDAGPNGFQGGMTATKYISITKVSKATATRDLQAMTELKILTSHGGGRNIHYTLVI